MQSGNSDNSIDRLPGSWANFAAEPQREVRSQGCIKAWRAVTSVVRRVCHYHVTGIEGQRRCDTFVRGQMIRCRTTMHHDDFLADLTGEPIGFRLVVVHDDQDAPPRFATSAYCDVRELPTPHRKVAMRIEFHADDAVWPDAPRNPNNTPSSDSAALSCASTSSRMYS